MGRRIHIYLLLVLFFVCTGRSVSQTVIDSLLNRLKEVSGEEKINTLNNLSQEYYNTDIDKSLNYANEALKSSSGRKFEKGKADALHRIAMAYKKKNEPDLALEYFLNSVEIRVEIKDTIGLARSYNNIGLIYYYMSKYEKAEEYQNLAYDKYKEYGDINGSAMAMNNIGNIYLQWGKFDDAINYYLKALKIFEKSDNKIGVASCLTNIGNVNDNLAASSDIGKIEIALDYYKQALEIELEINNTYGIANSYNNIGSEYNQIGAIYMEKLKWIQKDSVPNNKLIDEYTKKMNDNLGLAIDYYQKALEKRKEINDIPGEASILTNIGATFSNRGEHEEALKHFFEALEINRQLNNPLEISITLTFIGQAYKELEQFSEAYKYLEESNKIAMRIDAKKVIKANYVALSEAFEKQGMYRNSLDFYKKFSAIKDSMLNEESMKAIEELKTIYETEKKEDEIALLETEQELNSTRIRQQRILIYIFVIISIIILGLLIVIFRQFQHKKRANKELEMKNELITLQKKEITDSIVYARRIQTAILPPGDYIKRLFPERFILFKPRDIVSGDFYWMKELEHSDMIIATAADCTGHGVPGAFMSMLGVAFLNEIVNKPDVKTAADVLDHLRENVITSLHQTGRSGEAQDGMDISLCAFNTKTKIIQFAGANNPLYLIRNSELIEYKGDKMPIGIHTKVNVPFANTEIQLQKDDIIYIFSDGYADQFGGPKAKKFKYKSFKDLLLEIHNKPMDEQKTVLETTFEEWKGSLEQVDDIIVIGIKIS